MGQNLTGKNNGYMFLEGGGLDTAVTMQPVPFLAAGTTTDGMVFVAADNALQVTQRGRYLIHWTVTGTEADFGGDATQWSVRVARKLSGASAFGKVMLVDQDIAAVNTISGSAVFDAEVGDSLRLEIAADHANSEITTLDASFAVMMIAENP